MACHLVGANHFLNQCWNIVNWTLRNNFSEIVIEIITFSVKKMHLKLWSGNWQPFCLGLNELKDLNDHTGRSADYFYFLNRNHHPQQQSDILFHHHSSTFCFLSHGLSFHCVIGCLPLPAVYTSLVIGYRVTSRYIAIFRSSLSGYGGGINTLRLRQIGCHF